MQRLLFAAKPDSQLGFFYYNYMAILVTISNLHCISRYLCSLFIFIDLNLKIKLQDSNNILSLEKISLLKHHFYMNLARLYNAAKIKKNKTYIFCKYKHLPVDNFNKNTSTCRYGLSLIPEKRHFLYK